MSLSKRAYDYFKKASTKHLKLPLQRVLLKPQGFVPATGLHPLVSETASPGFRMPAFGGTQPADVPYAGTVVRFGFGEEFAFWEEIK